MLKPQCPIGLKMHPLTSFGQPIQDRVLTLIRQFYQQSHGKLPIVAYGSVLTPEDAFQMIAAGASLIQLDTACLTYGGPAMVFAIHRGLVRLLTAKGFSDVNKAVGADVKNSMQNMGNDSATVGDPVFLFSGTCQDS